MRKSKTKTILGTDFILHPSELYRYTSVRRDHQIYTINLGRLTYFKLHLPMNHLFELGVSKRLVKRSEAKHKDIPIGFTKTVGQTKDGITSYESKRGNRLGRVAGTVNGKLLSVSFGDVRSEDDALRQLIAYVRAQVAPPQAYFDLELDEMITFANKDSFDDYKSQAEKLPPLINVASGTKRNGVLQLQTLTGEVIGLFGIHSKHYKTRSRYGKITTPKEAALKLMDRLRADNVALAAYMANGTCIEFSPFSSLEVNIAVIHLCAAANEDYLKQLG
ncbi:hypothetical protein OTK49_28420 [Vibrio coralliirubri]|uniref:hypothetical protein n=1 Tax=Vibrio coralliirubri TaxID=1516159 RepID=UPI002284F390|nr:hypothetical protein [Vibrio coralliirubri]MCY9866469.1 hypothetical protein [Vibrio coralliirubri]